MSAPPGSVKLGPIDADTKDQSNPEQCGLDHASVAKVAIASLQVSQSLRICGENPEHVKALAETEGKLPPIIVHRSTLRVIDGMHRLRAAEQRGQSEIEVHSFNGPETDPPSSSRSGLTLRMDYRYRRPTAKLPPCASSNRTHTGRTA